MTTTTPALSAGEVAGNLRVRAGCAVHDATKELLSSAADLIERQAATIADRNAQLMDACDEVTTARLERDVAVADAATRAAQLAEGRAEVERLKEDNDQLNATFDLRHKADSRAIKQWQEVTGRTMTMPDQADLCVFLMMGLDVAQARIAELEAERDALRAREARLREAAFVAKGKLNNAIYRANFIEKWHADPNCDVSARALEAKAFAQAAKDALVVACHTALEAPAAQGEDSNG